MTGKPTRGFTLTVLVIAGLLSVRCPGVQFGPRFGCSSEDNNVVGRPFPQLPSGGSVVLYTFTQGFDGGLSAAVAAYRNYKPATKTPLSFVDRCERLVIDPPDGGEPDTLVPSGDLFNAGEVSLTGLRSPGCADPADCGETVNFAFDGGYSSNVAIGSDWSWSEAAGITFTLHAKTEETARDVNLSIQPPPALTGFHVTHPGGSPLAGSLSASAGFEVRWTVGGAQYILITLKGPQVAYICRDLDTVDTGRTERVRAFDPGIAADLRSGSTGSTTTVQIELRRINAGTPNAGDFDTSLSTILKIDNLAAFSSYALTLNVELAD